MFRYIVKIAICLLFIGSINAFAGEFCSFDNTNQKISGVWEGSDSYYFNFRINSSNKLCISILEDGTDTVRNIRDIVILDGKLVHLSYFTPITRAYVVYANIKFDGEEMNFDWHTFSSSENKGGNDSYHRRTEGKDGKASAFFENRISPPEIFSAE